MCRHKVYPTPFPSCTPCWLDQATTPEPLFIDIQYLQFDQLRYNATMSFHEDIGLNGISTPWLNGTKAGGFFAHSIHVTDIHFMAWFKKTSTVK